MAVFNNQIVLNYAICNMEILVKGAFNPLLYFTKNLHDLPMSNQTSKEQSIAMGQYANSKNIIEHYCGWTG